MQNFYFKPPVPVVMGILNVTDDSFYDGGRWKNDTLILQRASQIIEEGGKIIDVGAVSTRPGAIDIPEELELQRIGDTVRLIHQHFPDAVISVDTWRASVAECAVAEGASIINDVSGGTFDEQMPAVIGRLRVPYVLMHTTAKPDVMQQQPLSDQPIAEMLRFFGQQISLFKQYGCSDIILDPGFGFGKTLEQNYLILNNLHAFQIFGFPILVGVSRKSMIYKLLDTDPNGALNGTTVVHTVALQKGASFLRVHDVREAVEVVRLSQKMKMCQS